MTVIPIGAPRPEKCPLCGAALLWWDKETPARCRSCGARILPKEAE